MRDGIEDYEKIKIIQHKAEKSSDATVKKQISALEEVLQNMNAEYEFKEEKLAGDLLRGTKIVEELSDRLK